MSVTIVETFENHCSRDLEISRAMSRALKCSCYDKICLFLLKYLIKSMHYMFAAGILFPWVFLFLFCSKRAWQFLTILTQELKSSLYWCLNDKFSWQGDGERQARKPVSACIMHMHLQSHVHRKTSTHKHNTPPTLPRHRLSWQIGACASLVVFGITVLSHLCQGCTRFHSETKKAKKSTHVILQSHFLCPAFLLMLLVGIEVGMWSRSWHHVMHNS